MAIRKMESAFGWVNCRRPRRWAAGDLATFARTEDNTPGAELHPPIPIPFTLPAAGYVTLVIDDASGKRVRNLVSETRFPAGANVAWWDGADDLGRDVDAARHGLYHIPEQSVAPGEYTVRGLFHEGINLRYEMSVYNGGNPHLGTADTSGGWLTNHTPPRLILFVPGAKSPTTQPLVYIGSPVAEGYGAGLAWVGLDGRKVGGSRMVWAAPGRERPALRAMRAPRMPCRRSSSLTSARPGEPNPAANRIGKNTLNCGSPPSPQRGRQAGA